MRGLRLGFVVVVALTCGHLADAEPGGKARPAQCAGNWYPDDPVALTRQIDRLIADAEAPSVERKPIALIAPHAGYRYSAPVAAAGYRRLEGHSYKRVIVLAISHQAGSFQGVDVPSGLTAYSTPLGDVPIDRGVCDKLIEHPSFSSHAGIDQGEHSLELQLPFLQATIGRFRLVPLTVGRMSAQDYVDVAAAILPFVDDDTLLVASSYFTHFGPRFDFVPFKIDVPDSLRKLADRAASPILDCDYDGFVKHLADTKDTICGRAAITLLLRLLSMNSSAEATRAAYDTSGRVTGDWSNSVTYQSIVFTPRPSRVAPNARRILLAFTRKMAVASMTMRDPARPNFKEFPDVLRADGACFVTLNNKGRLRGCIGNMKATDPLYVAAMRNVSSACHDARFANDPVTAAELDEIDIEISCMTPPARVERPEEIVVGKHGLWIVLGSSRGVLLPQVAARRGWTREKFLAQTCRKAGLEPGAWKRPETEIYSFEAEVFSEHAGG